MYEIQFLPQAAKYIKKLKDKHLRKAFQDALEDISKNPFAGDEKTGDLTGVYGWDVYYARTNYEIAYRIYTVNEQLVVVVLAGTRENFYEQLKRYIKS